MNVLRGISLCISVLVLSLVSIGWLYAILASPGMKPFSLSDNLLLAGIDIYFIFILWLINFYKHHKRANMFIGIAFTLSLLPLVGGLVMVCVVRRVAC